MAGGVDDLKYDSELVARALKPVAKTIEVDFPNEARLVKTCIKRLESRALSALAAPEDTPPGGTYLDKLVEGVGFPYQFLTPAATKWIIRRLREGRTLVRRLLGDAEITGSPDVIGAAQRWLDKIETGPGENIVSEPIDTKDE